MMSVRLRFHDHAGGRAGGVELAIGAKRQCVRRANNRDTVGYVIGKGNHPLLVRDRDVDTHEADFGKMLNMQCGYSQENFYH